MADESKFRTLLQGVFEPYIALGIMSSRPALNESEAEARSMLVNAVREMLVSTLPFNEGAVQVLRLRGRLGGVPEYDEDFLVFTAITSQTDHLPLKVQFHLWNQDALAELAPEFERSQLWASEFAREACKSLLLRFGGTLYE